MNISGILLLREESHYTKHGTVVLVWQKIIQPLGEVALGATVLGVIAAFFVTRRNIRMEEVE